MIKFSLLYYLQKSLTLPNSFIRKQINKPIFIVGAQRSGTGFLMSVINESPEVCNWSEANYIWEPHYYDFVHGGSKDNIPGFSGRGIHAHEIPKQAKNKTEKQVKKLLAIYNFLHDKKRILHKNPFNSVRLNELLEFFPDCKIINVKRNPYGAINSFVNKNESSIYPRETLIKQGAYRWYMCNSNFESIRKKGEGATYEIQYSNLESRKKISDLFSFTELDANEDVFKRLKDFDNKNYKYQKDLSHEEKKRVEDKLNRLKSCGDIFE